MTKSSRARRTGSQRSRVFLYVITVLVALSMVCSLVSVLTPLRRARQTPTPSLTLAPPQPTPTLIVSSTATPSVSPAVPLVASPTVVAPVPPTGTPAPGKTVAGPPASPATPIAVGNETDFTFAICGDNRNGEEVYRTILDMVARDGSAFLINTGDLVYSGAEYRFERFQELMSDFPLPFFPVPGNHDYQFGSLEAYLKHSGAPDRHYSFDYGKVHFAMVESGLGTLSLPEMEWLEQDLSATDKPAKVVCLHYPPFDPAGTDYVMESGNEEFMELMTRQGVRYVFCGHIHSYDKAERDGVTYVITGGAGAPLYPEENRAAFHHYVRVTVSGETIETEVVRVD